MGGEGVMSSNSLEQTDEPINITSALKALSPWLNNPRQTVIQVEVLMSAATVLLLLQLILGSIRRCSNKLFIHGGLWLVYTLQLPLITYTLGLMQSSPVKIRLYPVWALSLFLLLGGSISITAYDLDDNKQWRRRLFLIFQYSISMLLICELLETGSNLFGVTEWRQPAMALIYSMTPIAIIVNTFGAVAGWMVNFSDPSKVVADYMKGHQANYSRLGDHSQELDHPITMKKGCKYLVRWRGYRTNMRGVTEVEKEDAITVEMVWDKCNEDMFISCYGRLISSRIKGACLSFALSHLLRCRFFGMDCAEAGLLQEARQFVLEGMLSDKNRSSHDAAYIEEAFRVIEVELGFLYDFFYTKYASIFEMETCFFAMVIMKMIATFALGVVLLFRSPFLNTHNPVIEVSSRKEDTIVTAVILGTLVVVEALQFILYLRSDWAIVSLACDFIITRRSLGIIIPFFLRKRLILFLSSRLPMLSYWQNKIGQYSVIEGSRFLCRREAEPTTTCMGKLIPYFLSLGNPFSGKGVSFVELPDMVKAEIVHSLKSNSDGYLTNGEASLQRNRVFGQFSRTFRDETMTQTERMLIWHIATDYCRIKSCGEAEEAPVGQAHYREVATKLSAYSAYLMLKAPELLPGNFADTKFVVDRVIYEATTALGTKRRNRDILQDAIDNSRDEHTIFARGLELGTMLVEDMENSLHRWKVLAEYWAERPSSTLRRPKTPGHTWSIFLKEGNF
jgi:hypothetical protein